MANPPTDDSDRRPEPEIIPPDRTRGARPDGASRIWISIDDGTQHRIRIARPGPFTAVLLALLVGLIGIAIAILFLGTVLIVVPAIILIAVVLVAAGVLRRHFGGRRTG
jgi:hypothetical protein